MNKLLVLMIVIVMTLSLAACGGDVGSAESAPEASAPAQQQESVADEQAKADEDYAKLEGFLNRIIANYQDQQALATLLEEIRSGQKEESALLDAYKQLAEDANGMLQDVQNTAWATNYYDDKAAVLTECAEALALYQQTAYEACAENDDAKLETMSVLLDDYDLKLSAFLDVMGVE